MYDIIIIGAGPAGMTAAIYASQARKKILILEKSVYGGQIVNADKVKNYPGFEEISGYEYANKLYNQVKTFNPDFKFEEVVEIKNNNEFKEVITNKNSYKSNSIIIATGAKNRKLGLPNEDKLIGKGVSYCSTCDGIFFKDKKVAITGGGNNAIDDALYLSDIANKVYLIYRQKDFKIDSLNLEKLKERNNVEFILNSNITELIGNEKLENIVVKDNDTGIENRLDVEGIFIAIGHIPLSSMCKNLVKINELGYIIADENCNTNIEGIFAAGDVRIKPVRQLTTACGDGTVAAINACKYLNKKTIEITQ
ncbi:MAG: thioredoxin-disulfide reductase [Bacilli bacterium]|nr:thioredoxin-disulfide reductase [Bacilli bacterium]